MPNREYRSNMSNKELLDSIGYVLRDVVAERLQQEVKWGPQNHKQMIWLGILAEEFGEAAKNINELHFRISVDQPEKYLRNEVRKELVQMAAVAVAMIESLDRNGR